MKELSLALKGSRALHKRGRLLESTNYSPSPDSIQDRRTRRSSQSRQVWNKTVSPESGTRDKHRKEFDFDNITRIEGT